VGGDHAPPALIHELLDRAAARHPARTALVTPDVACTYRELDGATRRAAAWLASRGVRRGDRVVVLLPNCAHTLVLVMAASRLGALFCVLNRAMRPYHLQHVIAEVEPALVVTSGGRPDLGWLGSLAPVVTVEDCWDEAMSAPPVAAASPGISTDAAGLIYTSGSTAHPKGVIVGHRQVVFVVAAIQERLQVRSDDVVACFLPLSFDYGLYQLFLTVQAGATLALGTEEDAGAGLLRRVRAWGVTGLPIVPSMARALVDLARRPGAGPPQLRFVTNTGERLPPAVIDDLTRVFPGCRVYPMFGTTECKRISILLPEEYAQRPESVGRPLQGTECRIARRGGEARPGEWGELVVRGPHVMLGYWRSPALTRARFRPYSGTTDCELRTGDVCSMDAEGYLYFRGRMDGIYKSAGRRVSELEVEEAARSIDGVRDAIVVRGPAGVGLFVTGMVDRAGLRDGLLGRLEEYKVPAALHVVDEMPRTLHGKVDRRALARAAGLAGEDDGAVG